MPRNLRVALTLLTALVILLAVNLSASILLRSAKIDMTEERLYSLSDGTIGMLGKLEDDVRLKLYYSRRATSSIPAIKLYADRVIELLHQYVDRGGGRISLEILDPRPDTDIEEAAMREGIRAVALPTGEQIYFGLSIRNEVGDEQAIPFLDPQRENLLEYDLSRLIAAVSVPSEEVVGIMSPLDVMGGPSDDPMAAAFGQMPAEPWIFIRELQNSYEVRRVATSAGRIDEDIDVLMVIHPKQLSEATQYAIDQFLMRGGRLIVLVDGHSEFDAAHFQGRDPSSRFQAMFDSDLPRLFQSWGIEMEEGRVVGDLDLATPVRMGPQVAEHPAWLTLTEENANQDEIISANLERLLLASPGVIRKRSGESPYTITPLLQTSEASGSFDGFRLKFGADPEQLRTELVPTGEKQMLALKITGKFSTAFPDGAPGEAAGDEAGPDSAGETEKPEHRAQADRESAVIVVADVDMLSDDYSVQTQNFFGQTVAYPLNNNLDFFSNAVDVLAGSEDLIGLRARGKVERRFTLVDELERNAEREFKDEEDRLTARVEEVNQKLSQLQQGRTAAEGAILSPEQLAEIERFQNELTETRANLRDVRRNLRQDIERLGVRLKFLNIALLPLIVILLSFLPSAWRSLRMRSHHG